MSAADDDHTAFDTWAEHAEQSDRAEAPRLAGYLQEPLTGIVYIGPGPDDKTVVCGFGPATAVQRAYEQDCVADCWLEADREAFVSLEDSR